MEPTTNLGKHAKKELERVGLYSESADYGPDFSDSIVATVETFASSYGHSGGSAELGAQLLERLLRWQTL